MAQPLKVLYVDDEADIRNIVEFALEDEPDIVISICASGQEALSLVDELQPDLVLLDVMMPAMDGPTTLQRLRERPMHQKTPVAFVTAKVQPNEVAFFQSLGAVGVIAKPFDPMTLADQVRAAWKRHHG